jgi:hypothetical protein
LPKVIGGSGLIVDRTIDENASAGRLRIIGGVTVRGEWFAPHPRFAMASVAGYSRSGTRPDETDLLPLIENFTRLPGQPIL